MVCANGSHYVQVPGAAHGGDFRSERFSNLDSKCPYTTRRAIHHDLVAWLDPSFVAKSLEGSDSRDWHRCRVIKRTRL